MKKLFLMLMLFVAATLCLTTDFAQYEPYTQADLPEGAIARFGKGYITGIMYSPDGTQVAVSTYIGVWIYDAQTGEELSLITGQHEKPIYTAAYSPDGKTIATGSGDGTVRLWNTHTEKSIKTFALKEPIYSIRYSPDGKTIATHGGRNNTIGLWNSRTGRHLKTLSGHEDPSALYEGHPDASIASFTYSPDGKTIVSGGGDKTVRLWNVHSGENIRTLTGHIEAVRAVAYSPDGDTIVSASRDKTVRLWDAHTGENIKTLKGHKDIIVSVAYSPDSNIIVSGGWDGMLHRWDAQTGQPLKTYEIYTGVLYFTRGHGGAITYIVYSPDGKTIATAGADGTMQWWDAHTGENRKTFTGYSPHSIMYSPDGGVFAILIGKEVQLRNTTTGEYFKTLKGHRYNIERIVFSPEGDTIATATVVGTVGLWDANTGENIKILVGDVSTVYTDWRVNYNLVYSPDGKIIATQHKVGTVWLWDTRTGKHLNTLIGHTDTVYTPRYSPDGKTIATYSKDETIRLWDVLTGENIKTFADVPKVIGSIVFSPDGATFATKHSDHKVRFWDTTSGENITTLNGHTDAIYTPIFYSSDGKTIATYSKDKTVRLWDTITGKNINTLDMSKIASDLEFMHSPEGDILAISCAWWDKTAALWNVSTGQRLKTFERHKIGLFQSQTSKNRRDRFDAISWIIPSPTDDTFLIVVEYGKIRLWNVHTRKPIGQPINLNEKHMVRSGNLGGVRYSPDGKLLATYPLSWRGHVRLWDTATGKHLKTYRGHTYTHNSAVTFSPDGRKFATKHVDGTVLLWDIPSR